MNTECKTFFHKDINSGEIFYKNKIKYKTDKEAIHAAVLFNIKPETIHKRIAYKCNKCGFWHIGRNTTVITNTDKEKLRIKHNLK